MLRSSSLLLFKSSANTGRAFLSFAPAAAKAPSSLLLNGLLPPSTATWAAARPRLSSTAPSSSPSGQTSAPTPTPTPAPASKGPRATKDVRQEPLSPTVTKVSYFLPHPLYKDKYVDGVEETWREPKNLQDRVAKWVIKATRYNFDWMSGFSTKEHITEETWIKRIVFLESIAGIPGSVAGTLRHLKSLRRMERDKGWINTLIAESENERMHLMTAIAIYKPGPVFRAMVFMSQGVFFNFFFLAYLASPRFCHRLVGTLEEEATHTYTLLLSEIDKGYLPKFANAKAPPVAVKYWKMPEDSSLRDVFALIRADEAHHRDVNHTFADIEPSDPNPFPPGY